MERFAPIIIFFVIFSIISSVVKSAKKRNAGSSNAERQQKIELARQQLQYRQQQLRQQQYAAQNGTQNGGARVVPDKPIVAHSTDDCTGGSIHDGYHEGTIRRPAPASGPEGIQGAQGARRASYAPGRTGQGMTFKEGEASENHSALTASELAAKAAVNTETGAEKLVKAISAQPAFVQGVIWSEILGKPLSE
ncbi:MAG: hypothetical protein II072_02275 [Clostridia bacterium]|nr:hypothetical protein [Clostridia bacterium]MBQ2110979.1 hypothetical protein [Clostridia bacterium]MBQ2191687.1 hypothetical protein [Clostridia bacterium]MBQ5488381.1 hypothetical protein [Clostridia bacterium]